ncbi:MAG: MFS transporter [Chloroflexi bacterium]|nr:MAG: MFS transporter [Chloroflexota bacterium]
MAIEQATGVRFRVRRMLRLGSFQIGSAMGDILVNSIWNRILISQLGIPAAPVSFLLALRYLLAPVSLWVGHLSDTRRLWGLRRTSYIWLGRGLMIVSLPFLGLSLNRFVLSTTDVWGWVFAFLSTLLYGVGTLVSGSPFLALVRDSAPPEKQGLAISTAETILIIFFAVVGIVFSVWMDVYSSRVFWEMVLATMVVGGFFWFFAVLGVEKRIDRERGRVEWETAVSAEASFMPVLRKIWSDQRTRLFFLFLAVATMAAWAQEAVLEPFGAEVFALPFDRTTRFNSYWQTATVLTLVGGAYVWRKRPPEQQSGITMGGLYGMALGMMLLAGAALAQQPRLIEVALLIFGAGFGVYTFGGLSLMAVMSSDKEAGTYLGLWAICILISKGLGTFLGGALRDILLLGFSLPTAVSYGVIFLLEAAGLITAVFILTRVDVPGFAQDVGRIISRTEAQILSAD